MHVGAFSSNVPSFVLFNCLLVVFKNASHQRNFYFLFGLCLSDVTHSRILVSPKEILTFMAVIASSTSALRVPVELLIQHSEPVFESRPAIGCIKGIVRGLQKKKEFYNYFSAFNLFIQLSK